jgi:PAS domain S-box-containing protein
MRHGLLPECGRKALSKSGLVFIKDPCCGDCPLAHDHRAGSVMAGRLEYGDKIYGIITVITSQDLIPEKEEQSLFKSFIAEFSFYLHGIDLELKRRTAEIELLESEEKFRTIAETIPGFLNITDTKGNSIYVSPNCEKITGYTREEIMEGPIFWVHEDVIPKAMELYDRAYKKMEMSSNFEYKAVKKNGEVWYASSSWEMLKDKDGKMKGIVIQTTDITSRKRAEIALNESRKLFKTLAGVAPVGIFHTDAKGVCQYVNKVFCKIAGISAEEAKREAWSRTLHPEDREWVIRKWDKAAGTGSMFKSEFRFQNRDGRTTWVFGQAVAEKDTNKQTIGYIGTITDINDLKRNENELKTSRKALIKQKASLEKKNVALREIIGQVEIEKQKIKDNIITNINEVVMPILEKMKLNYDTDNYIDILEHYLGKLASSFGRKIMKRGNKLTPREMEISTLIESGLTNKEISKLLNISCQTVENHRKNIRKKLEITNKNINLATYLRQLAS